MSENLLTLTVLLAPAAFASTAIVSWFQPGFQPRLIKTMSMVSAIISILVAAISCLLVFENGMLQSELIGAYGFGFSIRLDSVSVIMLSMISLLAFIIIKFSRNYLDGDRRQGAFIGRLVATIASVQLLVLSGNLGLLMVSWMLTSISLHRLLAFYRDRPRAQIAARKKFILARLGDVCLLVAIGLLYGQFGSGNLEVIFQSIQSGAFAELSFQAIEGAAFFLVLAAVFKSAQFPTHGWLIEVMETPTPVSALLHAGLLNAGPFLIIRMAMVMDVSSVAPIILMIIGGFTALFASVVYLTQTSVKTALGYSSIAHMGFSLMVCGMGAYAAAMLHLVAHSFYKAHSFLSSGSVIDVVRGSKVAAEIKSVSPLHMAGGIVMAMVLYSGFVFLWGMDLKNDLSLFLIGAVIVMGLSKLFSSAIASRKSTALMLQASLLALVVTTAFFVLESTMHYLLASQLPELTMPGLAKIVTAAVLLAAFGLTVYVQIMAPQFANKPFYRAMAIHVRNGFYANAYFDRLVGALHILSPESKQVIDQQTSADKKSQTSPMELVRS